jgi:hypothetical protein
MKKISIVFFIAILINAGCHSASEDGNAAKDDYKKTKEALEQKEKKNPVAFLKVTSKDKHNLIGQTVIKGSIANEAKVCVYKNVQLELAFFSKTGVLLEKDSETIYEVIEPGKLVDFKTKYFAPRGTDSVGIRVVSAKTN